MADDVWLVVGLGNPGPSYAKTRHNVGQMVADELAARTGGNYKQHKQAKAEVVETRISGIRTILAKPRSYMNESGGPVSGLLKFFKVEPANLIVLHDELDIDFGVLRAKFGGGDNGHNGLKSIRKSARNRRLLSSPVRGGASARAAEPCRLRAERVLLNRTQGSPVRGRPDRGRRRVPADGWPRCDPRTV